MSRSRQLRFAFVMSLTIGRIPLILVFLVVNLCLLHSTPEGWVLGSPGTHGLWFAIACGAMVLSALTDLFDGYFARKFRLVSRLGAYADPLTDKIFYLVSFPALVWVAALQGQLFHSALLLGLAIVFLVRDQWVSFLRSIGALHEVSAAANWSGKVRTIIAFPTICVIYWYLLAPADWWPRLPAWFVYSCEGLSLVVNLLSVQVYTRRYWPSLKREMRLPDAEDSPRRRD